MNEEQLKIEKEKLQQDREIANRQHEFEMKKHGNAWRIPVLVAITTIVLSFVTNTILNNYTESQRNAREITNAELARSQFCFGVINDLIFRKPVIPGYEDSNFDALVERLAQVSDCEGKIERIASFDSPKTTLSSCESIVSIKSLGWISGHKTNFCLSREYTGVHNPFGSYKSGGYCFKGNSEQCINEINSIVNKGNR